MTIFEHSFTLIGLVLGLALAEVLSGLVRTVRSRDVKTLGLLTPMLGVFVAIDLPASWGVAWMMRTTMPDSIWPVLGFGSLLSGMYYLAAVLVFPDSQEKWPDLDAYYMKHRHIVLGLMFLCFVITIALWSAIKGSFTLSSVGISYVVVMGLTLLSPWKWANVLGLGALIVIDIWGFFS